MRWRRRDPEPTLEHRLASVEDHLHVVEAVAFALRERSAVLAVLDEASSVDDAAARLADRFGLDQTQAVAITDVQVRRFVPAEVAKVEDQVRDLREQRDRYLRGGAQRR
jgi:DNA gyrase/topoisomerase IV subunit A